MKESTFFNKIKQIRDKAVDPLKNKVNQARNELKADAESLKKGTKGMPDYDADGNVTPAFKLKNSYKSK